jgi:hypothetical protein
LNQSELNHKEELIPLLNHKLLNHKLGSVWLLKKRLLNHKSGVAWESELTEFRKLDPTRASVASEETVNPPFETLSTCGLLLVNATPATLIPKATIIAMAVTVFKIRENLYMYSFYTLKKFFVRVFYVSLSQ